MSPHPARRSRSAPLLALAAALSLAMASAPASAQTGPLRPPPPVAVSQSEPGHAVLRELHNRLSLRQAAFNRQRDEHNGRCLGIPAADTARIAECRQNKQRLDTERAAYQIQLRDFDANQAFYQGRTLYLRKDYDGAIARFEQAGRLASRRGVLEGDPADEIDLARAAKAAAVQDAETANKHLCAIEDRANARPSWLNIQANELFGKVRAWMYQRYGRKLNRRTPTAICGVRG